MSSPIILIPWQLYLQREDTMPIYASQTTLLSHSIGRLGHDEQIATMITEIVLGEAWHWDAWIGHEQEQAIVYLHIMAPPACAGWYSVSARRVITAEARRLDSSLPGQEASAADSDNPFFALDDAPLDVPRATCCAHPIAQHAQTPDEDYGWRRPCAAQGCPCTDLVLGWQAPGANTTPIDRTEDPHSG